MSVVKRPTESLKQSPRRYCLMKVRVEFYGIPRQRAGVAFLDVQADSLSEVFESLSRELPDFSHACLKNKRLQPGYLANINGQSFTSDPATKLKDGDCILILSADAGG